MATVERHEDRPPTLEAWECTPPTRFDRLYIALQAAFQAAALLPVDKESKSS